MIQKSVMFHGAGSPDSKNVYPIRTSQVRSASLQFAGQPDQFAATSRTVTVQAPGHTPVHFGKLTRGGRLTLIAGAVALIPVAGVLTGQIPFSFEGWPSRPQQAESPQDSNETGIPAAGVAADAPVEAGAPPTVDTEAADPSATAQAEGPDSTESGGSFDATLLNPGETAKTVIETTPEVVQAAPAQAVTKAAPQVVADSTEVKLWRALIQNRPADEAGMAAYHESIRTLLPEAKMDAKVAGRKLFVTGLIRAAENGGDIELARMILDKVGPEALAYTSSNKMNLVMLMAASKSEGGVAVIGEVFDRMPEAVQRSVVDTPDAHGWTTEKLLQFYENTGALKVIGVE